MVVAQIALIIAASLWVCAGSLLGAWLSPTKIDGVYWHMIDTISDEHAAALQRDALISITIGMIGGAGHAVAAVVCRRSWGRWLLMALGGLYLAAALPLAADAVQKPSTAIPVYAVLAFTLGLLLLNASRRRKTAIERTSPDGARESHRE